MTDPEIPRGINARKSNVSVITPSSSPVSELIAGAFQEDAFQDDAFQID